jgi:hypothetical protein
MKKGQLNEQALVDGFNIENVDRNIIISLCEYPVAVLYLAVIKQHVTCTRTCLAFIKSL